MKSLLAALFACFITFTAQANPQVEIKTNRGIIVLELNAERAPKSVENFLGYVKSGFYNGTIFHRIIDNFMIQGGGFTPDMNQKKTTTTVENEAKNGLKNLAGTIAMARTPAPHSASSQFFINLKDNSFLDYPGQDGWGYAVFGKVVQGMDVVQKLGKVATGNAAGHQNVPTSPVIIEDVKVLPAKQ